MKREVDPTRPWRALAMVPLPFLWFMAATASAAAFGAEGASGPSPGTVLSVLGGLLPTAMAGLCWAPSRTLRGMAYLGYALCLSVGFALGAMLSVMSLAEKGLGEGSISWAILVLFAGSFVSGASLLSLTYLIVSDWRASRRAQDRLPPEE